ncbi:MAG TPA: ATP-dependent DNA helicase [Trueperaceae bacterium]|nr:ATP-dependent DNA helicase [Trueperaceae bacterium]
MPSGSFPFASYRSGQREALDAAREAFEDGKRFVVVEAPTGSGKSAIAVALTREAGASYVLTAQKVLQDQYARDFPELSLMKGRSNYPCLVAPTHAAAAPCIAGRRFPACEDCPYFVAKDVAMASSAVTMNYAYFLAELNYAGGFRGRELLVLDEAHNAEGALMGFVQLTLNDAALARAGITRNLPPPLGDDAYFDFAEELVPDLLERGRDLDAELHGGELGEPAALARLQTKQWLDGQLARLELLLNSRDQDGVEWVVERRRSQAGQTLAFKPVEVAPFAEELLFGHAERVLMLSATVLDAGTFLRGLGIDAEDAAIIRTPSSFPPENRPLVLMPSARLTRHHLKDGLPKLVAAVAELCERHPDEKGVIHAHSYRIAQAIEQGLPREHAWRIVTHHDAAERDAALAAHLESDEPTILLSPSMTEGIDLAEDLARWQALCKIPYPYLGDPQVARRMELDPGWYDWRTCLTVVQAYGRTVRSEDDYAVTYLLDADFPGYLRRQRGRFPEWFLEALQPD